MKNIAVSLLLLFMTSLALAESFQKLPLSGNRVLVYQSSIVKPKEPVLVFLPGIFRGYLPTEKLINVLRAQKVSFVFFHFAEQPDSVILTGSKEPQFDNINAQELAAELVSLVDALKISRPVPVTLSYSAVLTAHLDPARFPVVIETAPIGKDTDGLPENVVQFYKSWEAWLKMFPFYGDIWLKQTKEYQLRNHWGKTVDGYSQRLEKLKEAPYRERALQGYIALTRSSEGFDLRQQDFSAGPWRYFILGEKEEASRSQLQFAAINKYVEQTGHQGNTFILPGAGHVVPADQPESYVKALQSIISEIK